MLQRNRHLIEHQLSAEHEGAMRMGSARSKVWTTLFGNLKVLETGDTSATAALLQHGLAIRKQRLGALEAVPVNLRGPE